MRFTKAALITICLFCVNQAYSQNLKLPITNYTNQVYGRNYDATNRCIITNHQNFIYAGNVNGILEYDGGEWVHRTKPLPLMKTRARILER